MYARNFARGSKWLPGQIVAKRRPLPFIINSMMVVCGIAIFIDHVVSGNHGDA